jgi:hypothetical protein
VLFSRCGKNLQALSKQISRTCAVFKMVEKNETDEKPQDAPPVGAVPEDANQRELWLLQLFC